LSTTYHPQTNGQSEWANQRVEQYLHIYGNDEQNDWATLLPIAQYVHNSWVNETTQQTPFDVLIGHTLTIQTVKTSVSILEVARWKEWMERNRVRALAAWKNVQ
jgi:hypothetical protein